MRQFRDHVKLRVSEQLMEDKLFFICRAVDIQGELQTEFEGGKNQWMTLAELNTKDKKFESLEYETQIINGEANLLEKTTWYDEGRF